MDQQPLSIYESYDKGFAENGDQSGSDGSGQDNGGAGTEENGEGEEDDEGESDDESDDESEGDDQPPGQKTDDKTSKEPVIDPENGKYKGEYNESRFNGLMSRWQQDLRDKKTLEAENKELKTQLAGKSTEKPQSSQNQSNNDVDLPPELANADDEAKAGYRLLMKGALSQMDRLKKDILNQVLDKINEPLRQELENKTKVDSEIQELTAEFGDDFKQNQKAVLKYASDNDYPLGTLRQAFNAYMNEQKLKAAKKTVTEIKEEDKKDAELPGNGKGRPKVQLNFDPDRDGNKSLGELFNEGLSV